MAGPVSLPFADAAFSSVWAVDALAGLPRNSGTTSSANSGGWRNRARRSPSYSPHPNRAARATARATASEWGGEGFTVLRSPA